MKSLTPDQYPSMANAVRALAMDAVQQAKSGHPGAPMGMADMAVALWGRHLRHNPANPLWPDRDRFVLSNGHASMLLYSLLHLTGYELSMDDLRAFRQLHSKTPGHPEVDITPGVETTTGPLGQGICNAVGMALAEKLLGQEFNRPGFDIIDHHTYAFLGDGCLMEGVSHEACALAASWRLNKLIALYDSNGISIDGEVKPWFSENVAERFAAYGWNVIGPVDGHNADEVERAIAQAKSLDNAPNLIICTTRIGHGSPNRAGTSKAHGEPLGAEEIALTRQAINWPHEPYTIPQDIYDAWNARAQGSNEEAVWNQHFVAYRQAFPELAEALQRRLAGELPADFAQQALDALSATHAKAETIASRKASQNALEWLTGILPELLGGSADLTGSNLTNTSHTPKLRFNDSTGAVITDEAGRIGRHINYGVREFGMAAIMNGIALHGGYIPYGGTFLTFSDYSRNAIRMAALMKRRVVHVFTHDSIGLGEDGPTHQSVEHAASLRLIPGLDVWRPADTAETLVAWTSALQAKDRPSALLLSRQNLPYAPKAALNDIARGGYVQSEPTSPARAVLIATGSELSIAVAAQAQLAGEGIAVRVVSMPCCEAFDRQDAAYRASVLPAGVPRLAIEAGVTGLWYRYGCARVLGLDRYGESAPADKLFPLFGLTANDLAQATREVLAG